MAQIVGLGMGRLCLRGILPRMLQRAGIQVKWSDGATEASDLDDQINPIDKPKAIRIYHILGLSSAVYGFLIPSLIRCAALV